AEACSGGQIERARVVDRALWIKTAGEICRCARADIQRSRSNHRAAIEGEQVCHCHIATSRECPAVQRERGDLLRVVKCDTSTIEVNGTLWSESIGRNRRESCKDEIAGAAERRSGSEVRVPQAQRCPRGHVDCSAAGR